MKQTIITTALIILSMVSLSQGANEVRAIIDGAPTAYYMVRGVSGTVWEPVGQVMEVYGTGGRTAADYDLALSDKSAGMHVANFDTNIPSGTYYVIGLMQTGGTPADSDPVIWQEYGTYDGTDWTLGNADLAASAVWEEPVADHTAELTFGGELGGLDPNITLILEDTNELQTDWTNGGRLDLILDEILYWAERLYVLDTTVADINDPNNFQLTAGLDVNDVYEMCLIRVEDADDSHAEVRWIETYEVSRQVWVEQPFGFTPAIGDEVQIMATGYGGYLYQMLRSLNLSKAPVYYTSSPDVRNAAHESAGGTTAIDSSGADPP